jgi:hypothetical protein
MVGVWIAFEDVDETNGTLRVVPRSHKWPVYEYHNLNLPHPDTIEDGEANNYKIYEEFLIELITALSPIDLTKSFFTGCILKFKSKSLKSRTTFVLTVAILYLFVDSRDKFGGTNKIIN